jgi:hypothetical protein
MWVVEHFDLARSQADKTFHAGGVNYWSCRG